MDPIEWLEQNTPGFVHLSSREREAIYHFTLLWSLFEAQALSTNASANAIVNWAKLQAPHAPELINEIRSTIEHFSNRYFPEGIESTHFHGLRLRTNDSPDLVRRVLLQKEQTPELVLAGLFIIIFRLRNNLFHGLKWADQIHGQLENFAGANHALVAALSMVRANGA